VSCSLGGGGGKRGKSGLGMGGVGASGVGKDKGRVGEGFWGQDGEEGNIDDRGQQITRPSQFGRPRGNSSSHIPVCNIYRYIVLYIPGP
jgi:hypothetical protein